MARGNFEREKCMQKWLAIAALLMLSTLSQVGTATAEDYESGFGFGISVPNVWLVLTRGEATDRAAMFLGDGGSSGLGYALRHI